MKKIETVAEMQRECAALRAAGRTIALVVTGGSIHEGHLALIRAAREKAREAGVNPRWLVPTMLGLMIFGLVYVVVAYLSSMQWPIPFQEAFKLNGNWNLAVGFAFLIAGFGLTTRWR